MSDVSVKVQVLRNNSVVIDEFVMNPISAVMFWEAPVGCEIIIMPERLGLYRIKLETWVKENKSHE